MIAISKHNRCGCTFVTDTMTCLQAYGRQSLGSSARRSDSHGDGARRRRAAHQALDRALDQQVCRSRSFFIWPRQSHSGHPTCMPMADSNGLSAWLCVRMHHWMGWVAGRDDASAGRGGSASLRASIVWALKVDSRVLSRTRMNILARSSAVAARMPCEL